MMNNLPLPFLAFVIVILQSCSTATCEENALQGNAAKASIRQYDPLPPNTFMVVPDSLLVSSTREVEALLDALKNKGLLDYKLEDSAVRRRALTGKRFKAAPDSAMFYTYTLQWGAPLDAYRVKVDGVQEVGADRLFGREYDAEFHFNARYLLAGDISMPDEGSYFRKDCKRIAFRYAYTIDSLQELAVIAGLPPLIRGERAVEIPVGE